MPMRALNIIPFAEHLATIEKLYMTDENFKTLWDDYYTSKINLEKFRGKSLEDMRSELEYQQLTTELENEIFNYLNKGG